MEGDGSVTDTIIDSLTGTTSEDDGSPATTAPAVSFTTLIPGSQHYPTNYSYLFIYSWCVCQETILREILSGTPDKNWTHLPSQEIRGAEGSSASASEDGSGCGSTPHGSH